MDPFRGLVGFCPRNGGIAEWRIGGLADWQNGGMANGGVAEWQNGRMAESRTFFHFWCVQVRATFKLDRKTVSEHRRVIHQSTWKGFFQKT